MSLKNLFKEAKSQYLSSTSLNELTGNIESADYIKFYLENQKRFVPLVDYSQPKNFASITMIVLRELLAPTRMMALRKRKYCGSFLLLI